MNLFGGGGGVGIAHKYLILKVCRGCNENYNLMH